MNKFLWAIVVYLSIFLIWNHYPQKDSTSKIPVALKILGVLGLISMAALYRGGTLENITWMRTHWWGILGLIGWGYLVSALCYLWLRDRILWVALVWLGFIGLNILNQTSSLHILSSLKPLIGVSISGNVPSIVLAGLIIGILLKKHKASPKQFLSRIIPLGIACIVIAFVLRNWFIISKIMGTPTWAMLCNGISILLFALLYYFLDVKLWYKWSKAFLPAGQNSLTTYLAPDILYFIIWGLNSNILFYKQTDHAALAVSGSLFWALAMIGFAALLSRFGIRLKL